MTSQSATRPALRFKILGVSPGQARAYRSGALDAYDNPPEQVVSDGAGYPCRCCLRYVPEGRIMLLVAHRPFDELHPYAETGPIFLCAEDCGTAPSERAAGLPPVLEQAPDYLLKGYDGRERIVYGTGRVVSQRDLVAYADSLLSQPGVAFVDVRSSRNNCWIARITRD